MSSQGNPKAKSDPDYIWVCHEPIFSDAPLFSLGRHAGIWGWGGWGGQNGLRPWSFGGGGRGFLSRNCFSPNFRKILAPIKIKSALPPPPPQNPIYPPPQKNEEFYGHGFSCRTDAFFPGVHKIGAAISGPRIADKNFTDTRIFLKILRASFLGRAPALDPPSLLIEGLRFASLLSLSSSQSAVELPMRLHWNNSKEFLGNSCGRVLRYRTKGCSRY